MQEVEKRFTATYTAQVEYDAIIVQELWLILAFVLRGR
jgi:hypothetical protein